jgi:hypothetical protein
MCDLGANLFDLGSEQQQQQQQQQQRDPIQLDLRGIWSKKLQKTHLEIIKIDVPAVVCHASDKHATKRGLLALCTDLAQVAFEQVSQQEVPKVVRLHTVPFVLCRLQYMPVYGPIPLGVQVNFWPFGAFASNTITEGAELSWTTSAGPCVNGSKPTWYAALCA